MVEIYSKKVAGFYVPCLAWPNGETVELGQWPCEDRATAIRVAGNWLDGGSLGAPRRVRAGSVA